MSWAAREHMGVPKRKKRKGPARPPQEPLTLPCFLPWGGEKAEGGREGACHPHGEKAEGGGSTPSAPAPGLRPWEVGLKMLVHLLQVPFRTRVCGDRPFLSDLGPKENDSWQVGGGGETHLAPPTSDARKALEGGHVHTRGSWGASLGSFSLPRAYISFFTS